MWGSQYSLAEHKAGIREKHTKAGCSSTGVSVRDSWQMRQDDANSGSRKRQPSLRCLEGSAKRWSLVVGMKAGDYLCPELKQEGWGA